MRISGRGKGGKTLKMLTQEEGGDGKKTSGKDLHCYGEFTKRVPGIYTRGMREKRRAFSVGLPDRKRE
jgi:hypothetical protein